MKFLKLKTQIKASRKIKGLTQEKLAFLMGLSRTCVASWETGVTEPTIKNLRRLALLTGKCFVIYGSGIE